MINLSTCTHSLPLLFGCSLSPLPSSALIRSSSALAEASLHTPIDSTNAKITLNALLYIPRPLPITILYIYIYLTRWLWMMFLCSLATRVAHFRASLFRLCSSAVPLSFSICVTCPRREMLQSQAHLLWQFQHIAKNTSNNRFVCSYMPVWIEIMFQVSRSITERESFVY